MSDEGWVLLSVLGVIIAAGTGRTWLLAYAAIGCAVATCRLLLSMT